ncbi:retrovirus-related pol polyprotein from transposon TNT 1-94 [Tanacetum coccineum]|uniref:Retrovirus-related pol polyprotein from transposon TNT 1-94 n=1 Tax=Tanacetum coccineum TaxID=301880 RepID=A0ABQ4YJA0_9ASTR
MSPQPQAEFPQLDSGLAVPSFLPGDDPITSLNKAMAFLNTAITSCFPTINNQLRTSSNPGNQATIQDGRVIVQQVQGDTGLEFCWCYNCQGEGHMARQCTQPKSPRNSAWFKEKILLVQAQEAGQTDDLDAFDSDYDEALGAKAVLMANLFSYNSNVIFEMYYSEQPTFDPTSDIEITSDSNIISYDQYMKETESVAVQNTASTEQKIFVIMSVFEEISNKVAKCNAENIQNKNVHVSLTAELERYK